MTEIPDMHGFAWVVVNSSGGKDSQTALTADALRIIDANAWLWHRAESAGRYT